jgi:nucleoside-diphosphate-sugar epimerase
MRIFVAGATGAVGRLLVERLLAGGHQVTGLTRSEERAAALREQGAEPVVADVFDAGAIRAAVERAEPEVLVNELTDIPHNLNPRTYEKDMAGNDRIRVEGTRNLLDGAKAAGTRRVVAQSISFAYAPQADRSLRVEDDELWLDAPPPFRRSTEALHSLESQVLGAEGIESFVLRYGFFYGPRTGYAADGGTAAAIRKRQFPIVGGGTARWSFIHVDDAASATVRAVEANDAPPGVYNIVDDDPAPVSAWLPALAEALGAKPPRKVPAWLARLVAGPFSVMAMTQLQPASNVKAKHELGWSPAIASWKEGFRTAL